MREDIMEALNTIIDAENNHELRQAQTLQVSLQSNTHKTEQPIWFPTPYNGFSSISDVASGSLLTTLRRKPPSDMDNMVH